MTKRELIDALNELVADDSELIWLGHSWPEANSEACGVFLEEELGDDSGGLSRLVRHVVIR